MGETYEEEAADRLPPLCKYFAKCTCARGNTKNCRYSHSASGAAAAGGGGSKRARSRSRSVRRLAFQVPVATVASEEEREQEEGEAVEAPATQPAVGAPMGCRQRSGEGAWARHRPEAPWYDALFAERVCDDGTGPW